MRRSPVVAGIVAGLLVGAAGTAVVAVAGRETTAKPRFVVAAAVGAPGGNADVVHGPLPELGGEARAYRLGATAGSGAVAKLAAAAGVHGRVQADAGGWVVRAGKGLVRVQRAPGRPWFFTTFGGPCQIVPETAPAPSGEVLPTIPPSGPTDCPPGVACPPDVVCPAPTTGPDPEGVAVKALAAAGLRDYYAVLATKSPSSAHVTVAPSIDGRPVSGLDWTATVSADGDVTAASGFLANPAPLASYRLVGTAVGLERLTRAVRLANLTVTNVRLGLLRAGQYLVPAYLYEVEGVGVRAVPAVEDKYLQ